MTAPGGGGGTITNTDQMRSFASTSTEAAGSIYSQMTSLADRLSGLASKYVGQGGGAFQTTATTLREEVTKMKTALEGMASDVSTAGVNYAASDSEQQQALAKVGAEMMDLASKL